MSDSEALRKAILTRLSTVIDPETGIDVVRMRLIEDSKEDLIELANYSPASGSGAARRERIQRSKVLFEETLGLCRSPEQI